MKKLVLIVLSCLGIMSASHAMEQPVNLSYILTTCPDEDQIACWLDGKSFSILTQVCSVFEEVCNRIPTKYLAINFFDAARYGNKNLINRFIDQIFASGMGKEISWKNDADDTIKIFKLVLPDSMQCFLGDCSLYCVSQADTIVRCFWFWKSPEMFEDKPQATLCTSLNIAQCDDVTDTATKECLKHVCGNTGNVYFSKNIGSMRYFSTVSVPDAQSKGTGEFISLDVVSSGDNFIKKFGIFMLLVIAAQKNNDTIVCSIIDHSQVPDSWIHGIMKRRSCYWLLFYNQEYENSGVYDVIKKALSLRILQG